MQGKKGQLALFIMVGIVLLMGLSFLIYLNNISIKKPLESNTQFEPIKFFIQSCIQNTAEEGVYFIGLQGGYYEAPSTSEPYFFVQVPYYWNGQNLMPPKPTIEKELSKYITDNLITCIDDFKSFRQMGYSFEIEAVDVHSTITIDEVVINVHYPIRIIKNNSIQNQDNFISTINIDLDNIYNLVKEIIGAQETEPNAVPWGFIAALAHEKKFTFENIDLGEGKVLYSLIFDVGKEEPLIYAFIAKYNWSDLMASEKKVKIDTINEQNAYADYTFSLQVTASGENTKFSDYTGLFDINESTGLIEFIPKKEDGGVHRIMIKAYDNQGNYDIKFFNLTIITENKAPIIEDLENAELMIGEIFSQVVNASDPDKNLIFYSVETSLENFKINMITGEMEFIPETGQEGLHTIVIVAADINGEFTKKAFDIEVK